MSEITGKVNSQYNKIEYYLQLRKTNDSLMKANERLYNKLKADFDLPDTTSHIVIDTVRIDSILQYRRYNYLQSKVVYNSVALQNNFLELGRGANAQVKKDMGVVDPSNSVVGIVTDVSNNYAVVMSLLNKDCHISVVLKKNRDMGGTVSWDGKEPNRLELTDIRRSAKLAVGDSVVTSGLGLYFPYGMLVGTLDEVAIDKSTNTYVLKVKTAVNFYNLQFAYVLDNLQKEELNKLLDKAKKTTQ